jgi:hypothetical protein
MADFITHNTFDVARLSLGAMRTNTATKSKSVGINYDGGSVEVKVPKMHVPLVWDKDESNTKFTVEMSFRGMADNAALSGFYKMMTDIDEYILNKAVERSAEWFKKPMTREAVEFGYVPVVKQPNDPAYSPTFKVALYKRNDAFEFDAFDENTHEMKIEDPHKLKGCHAMALIVCTGVWLAAGKFGTTWKLKQIRVFPKTARDSTAIAASVQPLPPSEVDLGAISFSKPAAVGRTIFINYGEGNKPLVIDVPRMRAPFGVSIFPGENGGNSFSLDLSFDSEADPAVAAFQAFIANLENLVKAEAASAGWFRGGNNTFSSLIRQNNTQYPATIKFKIPSAGENITVPIVHLETGEEIKVVRDNIDIFKGARAVVTASCTGVWCMGTRFGISFRAQKIKLLPVITHKGNTLFDDDEEPVNMPAVASCSDSDDGTAHNELAIVVDDGADV